MSLVSVSEHLLTANRLEQENLYDILGMLSERHLDYADLFFQSSFHESWVLEDRIIKDGSYNIDQGVGVRAVSGEKQVLLTLTKFHYKRWHKVRKRHAALSMNRALANHKF